MKVTFQRVVYPLSLFFCSAILALAQAPPTPPPSPAASPIPAVAPAPTNAGPKIVFEGAEYDFGRSKAGEPIRHTFYFTNTGEATLELMNVQPQCGCTTAGDWSHKVEPGKSGSIPIQVNTANLQAAPILKTVTVTCNDHSSPSSSTIVLKLKGTIWKPVDVNPVFAVLGPTADSPQCSTIVKVVNNMEEPLELSAPESTQKAFTAEVKTNTPGKNFDIVISSVPPFATGPVQGQITLRTSSSNMPLITVTAFMNVPGVVNINPPQISVPPAPLANVTPLSLNVQNNSTNAITLSEAAINAPGVEVTVQENQPGRLFTIMARFPQGFEAPAGKPLELIFKTSHPLAPVVKVPVHQAAKPPTAQSPPPLPPGVVAQPAAAPGGGH